MKIRKSTAECAEINAANKESIEAGLCEAFEPTDDIKRSEEERRKADEAEAKRLASVQAVLKEIWDALPANVQACYQDPTKATPSNYMRAVEGQYWDSVELEAYNKSSHWSSRFAYWRICVGGYGDSTRIKVCEDLVPTIDYKRLTKVVAAIVAKHEDRVAKAANNRSAEQARARRAAFLSDRANLEMAMLILGTAYIGSSDKISVAEDGKIGINYTTLTLAQWQQVAEMKRRHHAEYNALLESFKSATV